MTMMSLLVTRWVVVSFSSIISNSVIYSTYVTRIFAKFWRLRPQWRRRRLWTRMIHRHHRLHLLRVYLCRSSIAQWWYRSNTLRSRNSAVFTLVFQQMFISPGAWSGFVKITWNWASIARIWSAGHRVFGSEPLMIGWINYEWWYRDPRTLHTRMVSLFSTYISPKGKSSCLLFFQDVSQWTQVPGWASQS